MGGGLEADLSHGAVPALWSAPAPPTSTGWERWLGPVLQVVDVRYVPDVSRVRPAPAKYPGYPGYRLRLSDGVYSQHATLCPPLIHLATGGDLRQGSVVRLRSVGHASVPGHDRTIIIIRLEILQTECALIGSAMFYKLPRNSVVSSTSRSMSYDLSSYYNPGFGAIQMGPSSGGKLSFWKQVRQIKAENLGYSDKPDLITVKATISCVTEFYVHCPLVANGKYGCLVHIQIQDRSGTASATAYECVAEEILGYKSEDLYSMKTKEHDHAQLDDILLGAVGKQYLFQLKVKHELLSGVRCIVLKAEKVNPPAESRRLRVQIDTHLQEGSGPGSEFCSPIMPTYRGP